MNLHTEKTRRNYVERQRSETIPQSSTNNNRVINELYKENASTQPATSCGSNDNKNGTFTSAFNLIANNNAINHNFQDDMKKFNEQLRENFNNMITDINHFDMNGNNLSNQHFTSSSNDLKQPPKFSIIPLNNEINTFSYKESLNELFSILKTTNLPINTHLNSDSTNQIIPQINNKQIENLTPYYCCNSSNETYSYSLDLTPLKINESSVSESISPTRKDMSHHNNLNDIILDSIFTKNKIQINNLNSNNGIHSNDLSSQSTRKYSDPTPLSQYNYSNTNTNYIEPCYSNNSLQKNPLYSQTLTNEYVPSVVDSTKQFKPYQQQCLTNNGKNQSIFNHLAELLVKYDPSSQAPPIIDQYTIVQSNNNVHIDQLNIINTITDNNQELSQEYYNILNQSKCYQPQLDYVNKIGVGCSINNLSDLFAKNIKSSNFKHIFEITSEIELFEYISKCTFYGSSIEAININKIMSLGLEKQELIFVIRRWLIQMFSNEYSQFTFSQSKPPINTTIEIIKNYCQTNKEKPKLGPFLRLKNIIHLYETFIKNIDVIKTILFKNSLNNENSGVKTNSNHYNRESTSTNGYHSKKLSLDPLFLQFTINSYHEYNTHKVSKFMSTTVNPSVSPLMAPTIVNCLVYIERCNDIKLFMLDSPNGALPDLIIMNLPHLWSRNGKQFVCHICENFYTRKYGLKIHLRTHNSNKPLECTVCKKTFRDPSNLVKHSKIHSKSTNSTVGSYNIDSPSNLSNFNHENTKNEMKETKINVDYMSTSNSTTFTSRKRASSFIG